MIMLPGEIMATEDTMTIDEVYKYLRMMRSRYNRADRGKKGELLSEMEAATGRHRKSLIRLLGGSLERSPRRKQRTRTYKANFDRALGVTKPALITSLGMASSLYDLTDLRRLITSITGFIFYLLSTVGYRPYPSQHHLSHSHVTKRLTNRHSPFTLSSSSSYRPTPKIVGTSSITMIIS